MYKAIKILVILLLGLLSSGHTVIFDCFNCTDGVRTPSSSFFLFRIDLKEKELNSIEILSIHSPLKKQFTNSSLNWNTRMIFGPAFDIQYGIRYSYYPIPKIFPFGISSEMNLSVQIISLNSLPVVAQLGMLIPLNKRGDIFFELGGYNRFRIGLLDYYDDSWNRNSKGMYLNLKQAGIWGGTSRID